jgi:hypothetical protein
VITVIERGVLPIMAANTLQAVQCLNFIKGIFTNIPLFAALVEQLGGRNCWHHERHDIVA